MKLAIPRATFVGSRSWPMKWGYSSKFFKSSTTLQPRWDEVGQGIVHIGLGINLHYKAFSLFSATCQSSLPIEKSGSHDILFGKGNIIKYFNQESFNHLNFFSPAKLAKSFTGIANNPNLILFQQLRSDSDSHRRKVFQSRKKVSLFWNIQPNCCQILDFQLFKETHTGANFVGSLVFPPLFFGVKSLKYSQLRWLQMGIRTEFVWFPEFGTFLGKFRQNSKKKKNLSELS